MKNLYQWMIEFTLPGREIFERILFRILEKLRTGEHAARRMLPPPEQGSGSQEKISTEH